MENSYFCSLYKFKTKIFGDLKMAKKGHRIQVILECTEAKALGRPASRYSTTKNKQNTPERIEKKKYNPFLRKHTVHKEIK